MRTHFAEVLARENACLAGVTDGAKLAGWRRRVVEELMTPRSPYVFALRQTGDGAERADFLDRWRELIAETLDRLLQSGATGGTHCSSGQAARRADADPHKTAVLILAALHGGSTLSRIAKDPWPLNAALDLALAPFTATEDNSPARTVMSSPIGNMSP
ncbi:hypothetical protein [Microbispora hainanensis]|uniref:Tetracyclin repressor-like C-terminal domain-containing protein n=1 Tax=Microbispora hainanensis TaxID=568844 RepID=A0A544YV95_9ACTN|nr:hypothetical protein [Microbispora hainanensis]TQS20687.1 hypothetical protein FLX08_14460 [Microbispora hainanensis]